jgi:ABC-type sulfate transport system substrate-binding protein
MSKLKSDARTGTEVFTLDEGPVTINFPASLCAASLEDLKQYLDIFYRKACRLTDDPVDAMDTTRFSKRDLKIAAAE